MTIPREMGMDKRYDHLKRGAVATRDLCKSYLDAVTTRDVSESEVVHLRQRLEAWKKDYSDHLEGVNVSALTDWARAVEDDPAFDPVAEWTALESEIDAVLATIAQYLQETMYTPAQVAAVGLDAELAAVVGRVEAPKTEILAK